MLDNKVFKTGLTALAISMAAAYAPASSAAIVAYAQDYELSDPGNPAELGSFGEGFRYFVDVWGGSPLAPVGPPSIKAYDYAGSAPNGGPAFSAVAGGEGGFYQGTQYLNIYNDYNNADQNAGGSCGPNSCTINANIFQEFTIDAGNIGETWTLTFDGKSPFAGGISDAVFDYAGSLVNPTSASAFIKTLDPGAGYATTNDIRVDMTNVSNDEWGQFSISLDLSSALLEGQLIQFGFNNVTTQYDNTGVYYDNICFDNAGGCPQPANPIPVPAAVWLFGSGLLGLIGVARRRKG